MKNQELFATLHTSLSNIKKKLAEHGISAYNIDISHIEDVINQFPKLSKPRVNTVFAKKDDASDMLQEIYKGVQAFSKKVSAEIKKEMITLEAEMHGTQNFSGYEFKRTEDYVFKKELVDDLDSLAKMILAEDPAFKKQESTRLKV